MGRWVESRNHRQRSGPYARKKYCWDDEGSNEGPTRADLKYLAHTLHGVEAPDQQFAAYDDRAGVAKRTNTSGGGYKKGGQRQSVVFREGMKPADDAYEAFKGDLSGKREHFSPDRVEYSQTGTPLRAWSPGQTEYQVGPTYGDVAMVHPTYDPTFGIDTYGTNLSPKASPLPPLVVTTGSVTLTSQVVRAWSCVRDNVGKNTKTVMSGISARKAAEAGGVIATGKWAWLHIIAFAMGGQDGKNPDVPGNLVAGTSESNIYHLAIESAARKIALEGTSLKVEWTLSGTIDAEWHLAETIEYAISASNAPSKKQVFKIAAWKHESGYGGDTTAVYSLLKNLVLA